MSSPNIRLMSYNPQWQQEFEQTKSSVLQAAQGWVTNVQHIGSTCLPDGIARPIVDVVAGLTDMQGLNEAALLIEGLNYARVESPEWCSDELTALLQKPRTGEATHTVLLVRFEGDAWRRSLAIRQRLMSNLVEWQQLQTVKQDNFAAGCQALHRYNAAKDSFFAELEGRINRSD